jgi:DNA-directed RNA polymerase specialized sigma subunit
MMKKAMRYLIRHQNIGSIPEVRAFRVRDFQEAKVALGERLSREPNEFELSKHLKWSPMEVRRMETELRRRPGPTSEFEDEPLGIGSSEEAEVIHMIQYELDGEEKLVYEYLFGMGGKPRLQPGQIATKLRMTPSKITRIKQRILDKVNNYL